jgi:cyclohexadieny/prephenate dehydrogenase
VRNADAVFHCVPVGAMGATAKASIGAMKAGAILTDVGSVKGNVAREFRGLGRSDVHVIPGHPIAGTEKSGPDAGFASLFENRWCILTPDAGAFAGVCRGDGQAGCVLDRAGLEGRAHGCAAA